MIKRNVNSYYYIVYYYTYVIMKSMNEILNIAKCKNLKLDDKFKPILKIKLRINPKLCNFMSTIWIVLVVFFFS